MYRHSRPARALAKIAKSSLNTLQTSPLPPLRGRGPLPPDADSLILFTRKRSRRPQCPRNPTIPNRGPP